jgi:hypothetical protein
MSIREGPIVESVRELARIVDRDALSAQARARIGARINERLDAARAWWWWPRLALGAVALGAITVLLLARVHVEPPRHVSTEGDETGFVADARAFAAEVARRFAGFTDALRDAAHAPQVHEQTHELPSPTEPVRRRAIDVPSPAPQEAVDPEALYARAEEAMRRGDHPSARRQLQDIAERFAGQPIALSAGYENARLAFSDRDYAEARAALVAPSARGSQLREPARLLACRVERELESGDEARACLRSFRRDFPTSAHDGEVLLMLLRGPLDCDERTRLSDEYLKLFPEGATAAEVRAQAERCAQ